MKEHSAPDQQPRDDLCAHGCNTEATVQHADGRYLCYPCYRAETGADVDTGPCPTCGDYNAYLRQAVDR